MATLAINMAGASARGLDNLWRTELRSPLSGKSVMRSLLAALLLGDVEVELHNRLHRACRLAMLEGLPVERAPSSGVTVALHPNPDHAVVVWAVWARVVASS